MRKEKRTERIQDDRRHQIGGDEENGGRQRDVEEYHVKTCLAEQK